MMPASPSSANFPEAPGSERITIIDYYKDQVDIRRVSAPEVCFPYKDTPTITWINVDGVSQRVLIEELGRHYGLHPLVIEDIFDTQQRAKINIFDDYVLFVLKMHTYDTTTHTIAVEQVSIILGENFVLTFQEERPGDVFDGVRTRLAKDKSRLRQAGADYLLYALIEAVINSYFEVIELFGEQLESVEDELLNTNRREILEQIHFLKRELIFFRRSVWPLRSMIGDLERHETLLIQADTEIYFRDLHDHILQIVDSIEIYRDMLTGMLELYLSSVSNKMNEIMKFLTLIGTIFIPLTFLAGVYGMNFRHMPELTWRWGYFGVWAIMLAIGLGMVGYFKRKGWL